MIRPFETKNLDAIMEIWLNTNISAHHFIDSHYWKDNYDLVKEQLPTANINVYLEGNEILGFIGISENFIAGLFVKEGVQSRGIGTQLLNSVKQSVNSLKLDVYKENTQAIQFYSKHGFNVSDENDLEYEMVWIQQ